MNPKRRRLKSGTIASFALISCLSLGVGYAQSTFAQTADDQVVEAIANDSDAVDSALSEAFGLEEVAEATEEIAEEPEVAEVTEEVEEAVEEVAEVTEETEEAVAEVAEVTEETEEAVEEVADVTEETEAVVEEAPVEEVVELSPIEESEIARRKAQKASGMAAYERGKAAASEDDYEKAITEFQLARIELEKVSKLDEEVNATLAKMSARRAVIYEDWADKLVDEATDDLSVAKYNSAIEKLTQAKQFNPEKSEDYQDTIDKITKASRGANYIEGIKAKNVDPGKQARDEKEKSYFEKAKLHYRNGRLEEAKKSLQNVLRLNPYNRKASYWLLRVEEQIIEVGKDARKHAVASFKSQVEWAWVPPLPHVNEVIETAVTAPIVKEQDDIFSKMQDKLDTIIIKKLDLNEATINEVVNLLIEKSVLYDEKYKEGINIILDLGAKTPEKTATGGAATDGFADDEFADDEFADDEFADDEFAEDSSDDFGGEFEDEFAETAAPAAGPVDSATGTITFSFKNMPLGEVIKYVCQTVNLKYRVDKHAILIAKTLPLTAPTQTRFFNVRPGFVQALSSYGGGSDSSGGGDGFGGDDYSDYGDEGGGSSSVSVTSDSLKKGFATLGVPFDYKGTQVFYNNQISKLVVTHTAESLNKIQVIINENDTGRPLVNITAKFVEVGARDITEMGMEWLITNHENNSDHFEIEADPANPIDITSGISKLSDFTTDNILKEGAGDVFSSFITLGNTEFKNTIRALDKNQNLDILSSPEVTTLSGEEASIKSITRRYFPESWTEPEPGNGNSGGTVEIDGETVAVTNSTPSIPEFGDATELGVILTVTPTVTAGSKEIELSLSPKVSSFVGYDEEIQIPFPGVGNYSPKMPIIDERVLETRVICDDGETVVLGGLMTEKVTSYSDRVPFLADIPLLGKLFQSEGEMADKKNLLVFVTAQLVDSTGRPMRRVGEQERTGNRGLPTFDF